MDLEEIRFFNCIYMSKGIEVVEESLWTSEDWTLFLGLSLSLSLPSEANLLLYSAFLSHSLH